MFPRLLVLALATALMASACASSSAGDPAESATADDSDSVATALPSTPTAEPEPATQPEPTAEPEATAEPEPSPVSESDDSPATGQLTWFLGLLESDGPPSPDEFDEHFTADFLAQVPAQAIIDSVPALFGTAEPPLTIVEVTENTPGLDETVIVESANGERYEFMISVEATSPHLIQGLRVVPAANLTIDENATIESVDEQLAAVAAESSLGIYDVTDGNCATVEALRTEAVMPLGSAFKLWILAELAHQIEAGAAAWDETFPVQDNLKSSPEGEIFDQSAGTEFTLREYAEWMISISDNSATDHLLARLGRENVEAALGRIGLSDPAANIPLLSTSDLFQLKFVAAEPNADDYRPLDAAGRRALLDELQTATLPWVSDPTNLDMVNSNGVPISEPRDLDLEWFGSADDLCRTMVHLDELARTPGLEPVADILEINPGTGLPFDRERWPVIRFKGGSEPGVLAGSWWLQRSDGRQFVLVALASDPANAINEAAALQVFVSALSLVS